MRQNEFWLLYAYLHNNQVELEETVKQLQSNIRFRHIDVTDNVELICAQVRLETFKQVSQDIRSLLEIYDRKARDYEATKVQDEKNNKQVD